MREGKSITIPVIFQIRTANFGTELRAENLSKETHVPRFRLRVFGGSELLHPCPKLAIRLGLASPPTTETPVLAFAVNSVFAIGIRMKLSVDSHSGVGTSDLIRSDPLRM